MRPEYVQSSMHIRAEWSSIVEGRWSTRHQQNSLTSRDGDYSPGHLDENRVYQPVRLPESFVNKTTNLAELYLGQCSS
ncbi:hypothetical protein DPMN_163287 [Dreissena polymorpha]|uniref:Uncharacterized protein n=1 Tax=Dreissena polymorpha TaxID=45954 RepID=A0A9D4ERU3_DREPO|nr:hypothetical protein DPMN_163287 [Dreissena polymorpha]